MRFALVIEGTMIRQWLTATRIGVGTLPSRRTSSLVAVIGIAVVVAVLIPIAALSSSFLGILAQTGRSDRVLILRAGSNAESASTLSHEDAQLILSADGLRRTGTGDVIGSAEALMVVSLPLSTDGTPSNVALRGVGPQWPTLLPEVKLVEGRAFVPGRHEMIVGRNAQSRFAGVSVGQSVTLRDVRWDVVGAFASGDSRESELLADSETILSAFNRPAYQAVSAMLAPSTDIDTLRHVLKQHASLNIDVIDEASYYKRMGSLLAPLLTLLAYGVGGLMGIGVVFAAMNTMYAAVEARRRDLAILRLVGFGAPAVAASVMTEAALLACLGVLLGTLAALAVFDGRVVSTLSANFTQVVFRLHAGPGIILVAASWAMFAALLGAFAPAWQAGRQRLTLLSRSG